MLRVVFDAAVVSAMHRAGSGYGYLGGVFCAPSLLLRVTAASGAISASASAFSPSGAAELARAWPGASVVGWYRAGGAGVADDSEAKAHASAFASAPAAAVFVICTPSSGHQHCQRFSFGVHTLSGGGGLFVPVEFAIEEEERSPPLRRSVTFADEVAAAEGARRGAPSPAHAVGALRAFDAMQEQLPAPEPMDVTDAAAAAATTTADDQERRDVAVVKLAARRAAKNSLLEMWRKAGRPQGGLEELLHTAKLEQVEEASLQSWYVQILRSLTPVCRSPRPTPAKQLTPSPPAVLSDSSSSNSSDGGGGATFAVCDSPPRVPSIPSC
jgi:hypothetical protein